MDGSNQWYMAIGGHQVGPVSQQEIISNLQNGSIDAETLVFSAGMTQWQKVKTLPAFAPFVKGTTGAAAGPAPGAFVPPPAPGRRAHDIDFEIHGNEMQFVEVALDPGEGAVAEAGSMMYMTQGIDMETVFGDGSQQRSGGVMDALLGAGKRLLTGESLFMTVFTNAAGSGKHRVAFGAPYPGKIIPMDLKALGGHLVCQKDSFLCAARGVSVGIAFQKKLGVGLFGGEGFIMQKLEGDGLCFVHAGGTIHHFDLAPGEIDARRHRMPRGAATQRQLRHPVRRRDQDGAVRRRRHFLRHAAGPRPRVAAVAAAQPHGRSHLLRRAAEQGLAQGRGLDPRSRRRPRRLDRRALMR